MTPTPWLLDEAHAAIPDRMCCICGAAIRLPAIFALPHWYHRACHERFHAALWAKENEGRTIEQVRQLVGEDVKKGKR